MKKLIYLFLILPVYFVSCSTTEETVLSSNALEETINNYVADNYPDVTVDLITTDVDAVTATLSSGEELTFTLSGSVISYANKASCGLSTDSLGVSNDNTASDSTKAGKHHRHHKGEKHGYKKHHNDVRVDSLPDAINSFLAENYPGYSVINAKTDTVCEGSVFNVMICDSVSEPVKLVFDSNNVYLMKSVRIKYSDVPDAVTAKISSDYATYTVSGRCSLYTLKDGSVQYKIYFKVKKNVKWVRITADGTVVCEKL